MPRKNLVHVPTCVRHDTCAEEKGMARGLNRRALALLLVLLVVAL